MAVTLTRNPRPADNGIALTAFSPPFARPPILSQVTAAGLLCPTCGTELRASAKFCDDCGSPITGVATSAEYKQVTVLFADVVHSMDIAAAVGTERLREIMGELVERAAAVVQRFGGTVDKFTGDGIMAVFGAPVALEDHAFRACLAALGIQDEAKHVAGEVTHRDNMDLRLRVGLNSGQVIAGEIGSGALGYTAVGEQVGMAQRMESAAPPGGVMLSESTARLVEGAVMLADPELVHIKGASDPVSAHRLDRDCRRSARAQRSEAGRAAPGNSTPSPRSSTRRSAGPAASSVSWARPVSARAESCAKPSAIADDRGVRVFTTYCESHTSDIPFHAVTGLLRAAPGCRRTRRRGRPARSSAPASPARTPKISCCSMTCSASPILTPKCPTSRATPGGGD